MNKPSRRLQVHSEGRAGILRIGMECPPCYEWLKSVLAKHLREMPQMDVDIVHQFQFSGMEGLLNHHIDLLVTLDAIQQSGVIYQPMLDYELVLLVAESHALSQKNILNQQCYSRSYYSLFCEHERLHVFTQFLVPAGIQPRSKAAQSMDIMVQLLAMQRGITVLPGWLAAELCQSLPVTAVRLGQSGLAKTLFVAVREADQEIDYLQKFIALGMQSRA